MYSVAVCPVGKKILLADGEKVQKTGRSHGLQRKPVDEEVNGVPIPA